MNILKKISAGCVFISLCFSAAAQDQPTAQEKSLEIYGFVQMDGGYNAGQIDPNWYDIMRPTKLPAYKNQWGSDGSTFLSVRQTRLGFKGYTNTSLGELKTWFEFDLFGVGADAGQTTMRLRHAYGELGKFGAGQTVSPFMDMDVFPNSLDYWGPNGMVFYRNVQFRYMPIQGDTRLTFAVERPGASADQGIYANRVELQNVAAHFPVPDLSGEFRKGGKFGYVEVAGIVRYIGWKQVLDTTFYNLDGHAIGWGVNVSTNLNLTSKTTFRGQVVYGQGIQNYMNDAPVDIGIKNTGNVNMPVKGIALPLFSMVAFIDHNWNEKMSTSIGYSYMNIQNSNGMNPNAFKAGDYALVNLLYKPVKNMMAGIELQYFSRQNYTDGFSSSAIRAQATFKYNFGQMFYRPAEAK